MGFLGLLIMDKRSFILVHDTARTGAAQCCLDMPEGTLVVFDPVPKKTRLQEEKYHALFGDVAGQCTHLNQAFDREGWKRLLIDQFCRDMMEDPTCDEDIRSNLKDSVKMIPSLDGRAVVSIGMQSRKFNKKTASAFIEWLLAFSAEHNVKVNVKFDSPDQ